jgi:hypothetical protein
VWALLVAAAWIIAVWRVGLLAGVTVFSIWLISGPFPFTADFSAWYAARTTSVLIAIFALAFFAFRTSLAGQKVFQWKLLED